MRGISTTELLALAVTALCLCSPVTARDYVNVKMVQEEIEQVLNPLIDDDLLPGFYASVYDEDGLVLELANGFASEADQLVPASDVLYAMMSMSKPIVSAAVLKLIEQERLNLDQPVKEFIPEFGSLTVVEDGDLDNPIQPLARDITIRDLLTHTAGFTYSEDVVGREEVAKIYAELRILAIDDRFDSELGDLSTHVAALLQLPLVAQPGEKFVYSISIDILGRVIELVTEQTLDLAMSDLIFRPLGMVDTHFQVPDQKTSRLAAMYQPRLATYPIPGRFARYQPYKRLPSGIKNFGQGSVGFFSGGGGLVSTADDYHRFLNALVFGTGEDFLSDDSRQKFFVHQLPPALGSRALLYNFGARAVDSGFSFGLGIRLQPDGDPMVEANHDYYFWAGAANTAFWIDKKNGRFGLFLAQHMPTQYDRGREIVAATRKLVAR